MAEQRKTVVFNVDDNLEKACLEYAKTINFSKWVKDRLKQVVLSLESQRRQKENRQEDGKEGKI